MQDIAHSKEEQDNDKVGIDELCRRHAAVRPVDVRDAGADRLSRAPMSANEQPVSDFGQIVPLASGIATLARTGVLAR
jgi:hypothetical protein